MLSFDARKSKKHSINFFIQDARKMLRRVKFQFGIKIVQAKHCLKQGEKILT